MPKPADFWDDRFSTDEYVYGVHPNTFVNEAAARWLPSAQDVITLGAGEGRNAVFLAQEGHTVTAVDYSSEGLRKARDLAEKAGVSIETIRADVREWEPGRQWDAVVITFLHLPPAERTQLYQLIHRLLQPRGLLIAEWFRPEQRTEGYTSGGPPDPEMMVTPQELREHFSDGDTQYLDVANPSLEEGMHRGPAATVRFVWRNAHAR